MSLDGGALARFIQGTAEVKCLLALDPSRTDDLPEVSGQGARTESHGSDVEAGNAIRRAAVVLLVSHFEGFLKTLCEEINDYFASGDKLSGDIPVRLRELHTLPRLQEVLSSGDDSQQRSLLAKLSEIMCLWNSKGTPPAGLLRSAVAVREITSAKPDVIDRMFALYGEQDICAGDIDIQIGDDLVPDNIRGRLDDIVGCRNAVAHGNIDRRPTDEDVERYMIFLKTFANRLNSRAVRLSASSRV